jgi:hypothetical protein
MVAGMKVAVMKKKAVMVEFAFGVPALAALLYLIY